MNTLVLLSALAAFSNPTVKVDGSSTVFPITEAVAEEFQNKNKNAIHVTVGISGTGGGFKKFCRGETDVQDASRPISKEEMKTCSQAGIKYVELPIAYDAMAVVVSSKNTWLKSIDVNDLKKMWEPEAQNKITQWNQVNSTWPKKPLKLFGAGSDSGTFDYFTEAIVGKAKSSRGDYTASEDDNTLVQGISQDENALGYVPLAYYEMNKENPKEKKAKSFLRAVAIVGGAHAPKKEAILPSKETVLDGSYFPLSRPIFIYINVSGLKKDEVNKFAKFYIENASRLVGEVKYVPLSTAVYKKVSEKLELASRGKEEALGTVFGESHVGAKIEDVLNKKPIL